MPAVAIPLIAAAASSGATIYAANKASQAAQPTGAEQQMLQGQSNAATQQASTGRQLTQFGLPLLSQSAKYYQTLAGGNRAATTETLAPQIGAISDVYGGTARSLSRFLRGSSRDFQLGEASRERGGQIASLFRDVRPGANAALEQMGQNSVGAGVGATGGAGSLFGASASQQASNRFGGAQLTHQAGQDFGSMLFQLLRGMGSLRRPGDVGGGGGAWSNEDLARNMNSVG